ncbi:hypothetical protein [Gloeocapsopsis sp. IPPAS B-1203]|uniref:hypothetical protein n=1 Tax=Gloeocapsopsis sp. IPPAS B-1203 TaxID=2049454 RepID=UPI000C1824CD|nr:hypothetical protein [Gloeocapsopsis sp. IPPAS B-1203]PIG95476.1 hypothetical protein CSQ79_03270 [Gloeocapsopsis sp. IPPAS B-1203]
MNEQQMKILHQKIHAGVKGAIATSIEQHRQRGQSISIWLEAKLSPILYLTLPAVNGRGFLVHSPILTE